MVPFSRSCGGSRSSSQAGVPPVLPPSTGGNRRAASAGRDPKAQVQHPPVLRVSQDNFLTLGMDFLKAEINKEMGRCGTDLEGKNSLTIFPLLAVKSFIYRNWRLILFIYFNTRKK